MTEYYVSGCIEIDGNVGRETDEDAEFFTLYEKDAAGLSKCIADFTDRLSAEAAMQVYQERDALQQQVNALAAGLGNDTRCPKCGSRSLRWDCTLRARHAVPDGRLKLNEVSGLFYLGCEECSETVIRVSDDDVTKLLNQLRQPEEE